MTAAIAQPQDCQVFRQSWQASALVIVLSLGVALAIYIPAYLHQDVAFLTWTADQVMRGAVFGRDVYDINPPLNFLIYVPAALMGRVIGFDLAIKLWTALVAGVAIACVWQTAERSIRLPVIAAMGLFFALAFPREFGQREQFAFLLTAPYVAGNANRRGVSILVGLMAGVGFALKPYFLLPLVLVFATRRRLRTEEWVIAATGLCYAASLLLFFQPYLFEFLPKSAANYWATNPRPLMMIVIGVIFVPLFVAGQAYVAAPQRGTAGYGMAAVGFAIAVLLHHKGFPYHYLPPLGFLALYLAALLENPRRFAQWTAVLLLALAAGRLSIYTIPWFLDIEGRNKDVPALLEEIDRADSFAVLAAYNFPAFPTAIYTKVPFVGISPVNGFISKVGDIETGFAPNDGGVAGRLALEQATRELARRPGLVIVDTDWSGLSARRAPFDGLAWFDRDPAFHALWQGYEPAGHYDQYQFYRRK